MRNHCSLFSFPLPLSYLERRFISKYNPHLFGVLKAFWNLGSFGDLLKKASEAWRMQSGILWDPKSQRRHDSEKSIGSRSLEGSSTLGRLGLEGLFLFVYSKFILYWICQVLKTQVLCIQNPNLYCWQTMIKTMYLSCFRSAQSWFLVVKLE